MIKLEVIKSNPQFSRQLENKILYSDHQEDISISYQSTYTLKYVLEGTKSYHFNNQNIEIAKDQYLILNNHQITTEAKKGTKGLSFFLSPSLLDEVYSYHTNSQSSLIFFEIPQRKSNDNVGAVLNEITLLFKQTPFVFKDQIDHLFFRLSEAIVQERLQIDDKFENLNIIKYNTKKEILKLIAMTKEYLNDHLSEEISLDKISKTIGISKYYLHRVFTEIQGNTPLAYLTFIRLEKAKNCLQSSKDSIFEIAMKCGFDNTAYFSNTFKKYIGYSPTQYRKRA